MTDAPKECERLLSSIIVGAGPPGVWVTGQIAELANRTLTDVYSNFSTSSAKIYLLDGAPQVLPRFVKRLGRNSHRYLENLSVDVRLNGIVTDVNAESVNYNTIKD